VVVLKPVLAGLRQNVALAPLTTYNIGGPADFYCAVNSKIELAKAISNARNSNRPFFILGTGANVLISDQGFRGLVIHNQAANYRFNGDRLVAESGATISDLIEASTAYGLSGLEHFVGIPSSVGGAIWQNLHFLNPERTGTIFIAEIIESAQVVEESGKVRTVDQGFFKFGYDDSILHHRPIIVLEVTFKLHPRTTSKIRAQAQANLAWRRAHQPQLDEFASCGSVFKKIEGIGAGRLIDQCGLKGLRLGNIQVSDKNANYLVNLGGGKAADVRKLIAHVQAIVLKKTGYRLEPEIGFVGEF
jgi:UDP-N-acetylmuramate dehydrogenase